MAISLILVGFTSLATRIFRFGFPLEVVFDEVHYGKYIAAYFNSSFFFDVHPPLIKTLLFWWSKLLGLSGHPYLWNAIGDPLPPGYILVRILPLVIGTCLPIIVYLILKKIGLSSTASLSVGLILSFENSLIIVSRYILPETFILFFGFSSILFYLYYYEKKSKIFLIISAVLSAMAVSSKWTGLSFPFLILFLHYLNLIKDGANGAGQFFKTFFLITKKIFRFFSFYIITIIFVYLLIFLIHFSLLPNTGTGYAYFSPSFRNHSVMAKTYELNKAMFNYNTGFNQDHNYSSKWISWPLMHRPICYWKGGESSIYLFGNLFVYWAGFAAIIALAINFLVKLASRKKHKIAMIDSACLFILVGFTANFLPFAFIDRVMFIYHYQVALVFSAMALALLIDRIFYGKIRLIILVLTVVMSATSYIYFSPLIYGTKITEERMESLMWFKSWR